MSNIKTEDLLVLQTALLSRNADWVNRYMQGSEDWPVADPRMRMAAAAHFELMDLEGKPTWVYVDPEGRCPPRGVSSAGPNQRDAFGKPDTAPDPRRVDPNTPAGTDQGKVGGLYRTYEEWSEDGYFVCRGERSHKRVNGKAVFSEHQVYRPG